MTMTERREKTLTEVQSCLRDLKEAVALDRYLGINAALGLAQSMLDDLRVSSVTPNRSVATTGATAANISERDLHADALGNAGRIEARATGRLAASRVRRALGAPMRILVIDSHKSSTKAPAENLHWKNAQSIAEALSADLIWSYPGVNDNIEGGYEAIVFVHASHYAFTDYAWLQRSPDAKLFYVTNEYNLGEPRTLWSAVRDGRKYTVIANHPPAPSKLVKRHVEAWHEDVNLNALRRACCR
jgi:hypothetical protein